MSCTFLEAPEPKQIEETEDIVYTFEKSKEIVQDWIVNNSPTYKFDGDNLQFESSKTIIEDTKYIFTFSFDSAMAGYGDRSDQMLAQVITYHTMEVIVDKGEVISAITDDVYDEIKGEMIEEQVQPENLSLYFLQVIDGQEEFVKVEREVYDAITPKLAIENLLAGVSLEEAELGFITSINTGVRLNDLYIENNVAYVDFDEKLNFEVAGSAMVMSIVGQIEKTLLEFDEIDEVVISIEGETEGILEP